MSEKVRTVFFGEEDANYNEEATTYLAEFLDVYAHQILYAYRHSFPRLKFQSRSFDGLIVQQCSEPQIVEYVEKTRKSLARWIKRRKVDVFSVILSDNQNPAFVPSISTETKAYLQYQVHFKELFEAFETNDETDVMEETTEQLDQLKEQVRAIVSELQAWSVTCGNTTRESLYLHLIVSLKPGTRATSKYGEHVWKRVKPSQRSNDAISRSRNAAQSRILPTCGDVDCEIAKIRFVHIDMSHSAS